MFGQNINSTLGFNLIVVADYSEWRQAKFPKKRKNRRWMKKYRKKYGYKFFSRPMIPNDDLVVNQDNQTVYGSARRIQQLKSELQFGLS